MAAGKEIKRLRGKEVTASKAAKFIGVGVDRLRKWEERDTDPADTGDRAKVEAYFGVNLEELNTLKSFDFVERKALKGQQISPGLVPAEDLIQVLKEHNEFLRRNFELSLAGISIQAASILAHVATSLEKDDEREAAGNTEKLRQLKTDTGRRIGEKLVVSVKNDKKVAGS